MWKNNTLDEVQLGLISQNIVTISGEVDWDMAMYIREALLRLTAKGSPAVTLLVTSSGGNVAVGLDIYDALRFYAGEITGVVHGYSRSTATIILQGCRKRVAMRHARVMVHHICNKEISLDVLRDEIKLKKAIEDIERAQQRFYTILADRTGRSVGEIREVCVKGEDMSSEEALAFGLVEEIR